MRRLYIPDTHFPYSNMDMLHEVYKFNLKFKANKVYQTGDFVDFYGLSKFVKSPKAPNPALELTLARKQIKQFAKWFPNVTIIMGNHEKRLYKRISEAGVPSPFIRSLSAVLELPRGLQYVNRDYLELDSKTVLAHGHLCSSNAKKTHQEFYGKNVIIGHLHNQLGVEFNPRSKDRLWGMSTSCIVDKDSIAMAYGNQDWKNIICGFGYEESGNPHVQVLK